MGATRVRNTKAWIANFFISHSFTFRLCPTRPWDQSGSCGFPRAAFVAPGIRHEVKRPATSITAPARRRSGATGTATATVGKFATLLKDRILHATRESNGHMHVQERSITFSAHFCEANSPRLRPGVHRRSAPKILIGLFRKSSRSFRASLPRCGFDSLVSTPRVGSTERRLQFAYQPSPSKRARRQPRTESGAAGHTARSARGGEADLQ